MSVEVIEKGVEWSYRAITEFSVNLKEYGKYGDSESQFQKQLKLHADAMFGADNYQWISGPAAVVGFQNCTKTDSISVEFPGYHGIRTGPDREDIFFWPNRFYFCPEAVKYIYSRPGFEDSSDTGKPDLSFVYIYVGEGLRWPFRIERYYPDAAEKARHLVLVTYTEPEPVIVPIKFTDLMKQKRVAIGIAVKSV